MTSSSSEIVKIFTKGVVCKSNFGLYENTNIRTLHMLSIYGAPQQVKALLAAYTSSHTLETSTGEVFRRGGFPLHFRGNAIGYGKHHGILWSEGIGRNIIVWFNDVDRMKMIKIALSQRKIPFDVAWLPELVSLLEANEYLEPLAGWGGVRGYICNWGKKDDAVCDLICKELLSPSKLRKVA